MNPCGVRGIYSYYLFFHFECLKISCNVFYLIHQCIEWINIKDFYPVPSSIQAQIQNCIAFTASGWGFQKINQFIRMSLRHFDCHQALTFRFAHDIVNIFTILPESQYSCHIIPISYFYFVTNLNLHMV